MPSDSLQTGAGVEPLVGLITQNVIEELKKNSFTFGPNLSTIAPQGLVEVQPSTSNPGSIPQFPIAKNQEHDNFDKSFLLKLISRRQRSAAKKVLDVIELKPQELNFDSSGSVFIDQTSIPQANFHVIFPLLFKKGQFSKIPGYEEVCLKLKDLGVLSNHQKLSLPLRQNSTKDEHWYYLGP